MKDIFKSILKTKLRTIFSVLIVLAVSITACISISMIGGFGGDKLNKTFDQNQNSTQGSSETTTSSDLSATALQTLDTDSSSSENDDSNSTNQFSSNQMPNNMQDLRSNSNAVYILIGTCVLGGVLLVIVNIVSATKRKKALLSGSYDKTDISKLKKSVFLETIIIVVATGIIGTAAGAVIASPVSNLIREQSFSQNENGFVKSDNSNGIQPPTNSNGETQTMPNKDNQNGTQFGGTNDNSSNDNSNFNARQGRDFANKGDTMSLNYIAIILGSLGIVIVLSLVSGASAMLCINDKLPITDEDDKNSDGDDDFDDDDFDDDDMEEDDE